jgi:hypothetical protein
MLHDQKTAGKHIHLVISWDCVMGLVSPRNYLHFELSKIHRNKKACPLAHPSSENGISDNPRALQSLRIPIGPLRN